METKELDMNNSEIIKKSSTRTISSGESKKLSVQLGKNGRPIVKYDDLRSVRADANGDQPKDGFGIGELY